MSRADGAPARRRAWRLAVWLALAVMAAGVVWRLPPIPQDPAYHAFADRRRILGVPNALDVLSNLPFVAVGALGIRRVAGRPGGARWERAAFLVLFTGVLLTGVGSGSYHLAPTTATLVWDRLPMTLAFMALLALVLGERLGGRAGAWLLPPALALGLWSVVSWHLGERVGAGDLRLYGLVQFAPMLAIPLALALYPRRWLRTGDLLAVLGWYAAAKVSEALDAPIFGLGGLVSGHTLKHLAAATATAWLLRVERRWGETRAGL